MKTGFFVSTAVAIFLAVVVVFGMGRMSKLEGEIAELKEGDSPSKNKSMSGGSVQPAPVRSGGG